MGSRQVWLQPYLQRLPSGRGPNALHTFMRGYPPYSTQAFCTLPSWITPKASNLHLPWFLFHASSCWLSIWLTDASLPWGGLFWQWQMGHLFYYVSENVKVLTVSICSNGSCLANCPCHWLVSYEQHRSLPWLSDSGWSPMVRVCGCLTTGPKLKAVFN